MFQCINDCSCVQCFSFAIDAAEPRSVNTASTAQIGAESITSMNCIVFSGKKHFFQQASSVLMLSHSLLCSQDVTGSDINEDVRTSLIFEGAGLDFTHQALSLTRSIASASSSAGATVSDQVGDKYNNMLWM